MSGSKAVDVLDGIVSFESIAFYPEKEDQGPSAHLAGMV